MRLGLGGHNAKEAKKLNNAKKAAAAAGQKAENNYIQGMKRIAWAGSAEAANLDILYILGPSAAGKSYSLIKILYNENNNENNNNNIFINEFPDKFCSISIDGEDMRHCYKPYWERWLEKHDNGNPKGVYEEIKFSGIKKKIAPTFKELIKYLKDRPPTPMKDENNDNIFNIVANFVSKNSTSLFNEDIFSYEPYEPLELLHLKKIVKTVVDSANAAEAPSADLANLAAEAAIVAAPSPVVDSANAAEAPSADLANLAAEAAIVAAPSPVVDLANVAEAKKLLLQDKDIISEMREKIALLITNDEGKINLREYFATDPYAYTLCKLVYSEIDKLFPEFVEKPVDVLEKTVDVLEKPVDVLEKPVDVLEKTVDFKKVMDEVGIPIHQAEEIIFYVNLLFKSITFFKKDKTGFRIVEDKERKKNFFSVGQTNNFLDNLLIVIPTTLSKPFLTGSGYKSKAMRGGSVGRIGHIGSMNPYVNDHLEKNSKDIQKKLGYKTKKLFVIGIISPADICEYYGRKREKAAGKEYKRKTKILGKEITNTWRATTFFCLRYFQHSNTFNQNLLLLNLNREKDKIVKLIESPENEEFQKLSIEFNLSEMIEGICGEKLLEIKNMLKGQFIGKITKLVNYLENPKWKKLQTSAVEELIAHYDSRSEEYVDGQLLIAVGEEQFAAVKLILARNIDPNKITEDITPLYIASMGENVEIVEALLNSKADPNKEIEGLAPLEGAMIKGQKNIIEALLKSKADPNKKNKEGETPLHAAVIDKKKEIVDVLLKYNAAPNTPSSEGVTPLHIAVYKQNLEIVSQLLTAKANPKIRDLEGLSPCIIQTSDEVKKLLTPLCKNDVPSQNIAASSVV